MKITRTSAMTGNEHTLDLDVTQEQYDIWEKRIGPNSHIQTVMSNLSVSDREFIISGITKEEWDAEFYDPTTSISDLELTVRTTNCLASIGVNNVRDLSNCRAVDLLKVANFHNRCLKEVIATLADYNLTLTA